MVEKFSSSFGFQVVAVTFRPDGKEIAVSALNAEITFWTIPDLRQYQCIECRLVISVSVQV